jgi:hypothetical protein
MLQDASRADLNARFEEEFGRVPASRASLEFLRQNLSWAAQSRAVGQEPGKRRQQLIRQLNQVLTGGRQHQHLYRAGTRFVREWQGQVYEVTVLDQGYVWEGRVYPNLTRIATEITGTKWSGPRFFGLNGSSDGQS